MHLVDLIFFSSIHLGTKPGPWDMRWKLALSQKVPKGLSYLKAYHIMGHESKQP